MFFDNHVIPFINSYYSADQLRLSWVQVIGAHGVLWGCNPDSLTHLVLSWIKLWPVSGIPGSTLRVHICWKSIETHGLPVSRHLSLCLELCSHMLLHQDSRSMYGNVLCQELKLNLRCAHIQVVCSVMYVWNVNMHSYCFVGAIVIHCHMSVTKHG